MIGDHHRRTAGRATLLVRATDEILGTHKTELTAWQPLFENAKKIRALLAELQDLTLGIIETSPRQEQ
jgi:hypothetical protein